MSMTPNSSETSYITVEQFLNRKDWRTVAQLVMDDGSQAAKEDLPTNENLLTILMGSSGEIESYLVASGRYSAEDLQAANGISQRYLQDIVADIAMWNLFCRRDAPGPPETVTLKKEDAWKKLGQLASGETVLTFQQVVDASVPTNEYLNNQDLKNLNLFSDSCRRALGVRNAFRRGPF